MRQNDIIKVNLTRKFYESYIPLVILLIIIKLVILLSDPMNLFATTVLFSVFAVPSIDYPWNNGIFPESLGVDPVLSLTDEGEPIDYMKETL